MKEEDYNYRLFNDLLCSNVTLNVYSYNYNSTSIDQLR